MLQKKENLIAYLSCQSTTLLPPNKKTGQRTWTDTKTELLALRLHQTDQCSLTIGTVKPVSDKDLVEIPKNCRYWQPKITCETTLCSDIEPAQIRDRLLDYPITANRLTASELDDIILPVKTKVREQPNQDYMSLLAAAMPADVYYEPSGSNGHLQLIHTAEFSDSMDIVYDGASYNPRGVTKIITFATEDAISAADILGAKKDKVQAEQELMAYGVSQKAEKQKVILGNR